MIFRIVYNGIDLMGSDLDSCVLNPSLEQELNTAGSLTFTMPPTHPMWGAMKVFVGDIEVYENGELIFFGRIVNIDQNWNNERIIECEGALAFFNDTYIDGHVRWDEEGTTVGSFFTDIVNRHNALVPDNRKIFVGNIDQSFMNYLVTREVEWEKTLDVISQMCIDTNGGWLMLRKDLEEDKIYIDWIKDITSGIDQPVQFGLNLLDVTKSYHGEDICTAVIPRGEQNDEGVYLDISEMPTVSDVGQVDHTYGSNILYHHAGVENHGAVLQVHDFSSCATKEDLYEEARVWLIKKNTDVATIEVEAAELGYFGDGYPIFKVGKLVEVIDGIHFPDESTVTYPMYKISMNLDSGKKQITIGTPPKKELTQIYASDVDSTGNGGVKSGTSSGGGSGGSGSGDGVTDVIVNGSSVVNNHVASFSAVSTNQMNTAINNATSGLASTGYVDNAVAPKANTSDVNTALALKANISDVNQALSTKANTSDVISALALKADKTEIIDVVANPSGTGSTDLAKLKVGNDIYNIPSGGGGTEVEANPFEPATDDLNTIKIGETVYDIPGGGSSTNYGKFTCDTLFVNDPLPHPTQSGTANVTRNYTLSKSIDDYDAVYVIVYGYYNDNGSIVDGPNQKLSGMIFKSDYYLDNNWLFNASASSSNDRLFLKFTDDTHVETITTRSDAYNERVLYKVYGLKFENKLINRSDIYSEEERMIGRWTDGKPLYQKTTILTGSYTGSVNNVSIGIENKNVETICKISCVGITSGGSTFLIPYVNASSPSDNSGFAILSSYLVNLRLGTITITKLQFTIQYTKTTDSADSGVIPEDPQMVMMSDYYSEDEQVVGRWTDGKPLYQKTIPVTLPSSDGVVCAFSADVDYMTDIHYHGLDTSNFFNANSSYGSTTFYYNKSNNSIYMDGHQSWMSGDSGYFTFQYTKTTDTPGTGPTPGNLIYLPALYSEEEREVGVWTDGKPLYEKTINFGSLPNNTTKTVSSGLSNISVQQIFGVTKASNGFTMTLPHREISGSGNIDIVYQADNYIRIKTDYNYSGNTAYVTFQYTKTTDQPGSGTWTPEGQYAHHYSTSEKVVGTWIDGSTVYERTWDFGTSGEMEFGPDTWVNTTIPRSNINRIVKVNAISNSGVDWGFICANCDSGSYVQLYHSRPGNKSVKVRYLTLRYTKSS